MVTLTGAGFGAQGPGASVYFTSEYGTPLPAANIDVLSWTPTAIQVKAPVGIGVGPVEVIRFPVDPKANTGEPRVG